MTRRGSVVYYMTAVVFGSLFLAASSFLYDRFVPQISPPVIAGAFLQSYFSVVVTSFVPLLTASFALRRLAVQFRWTRIWNWLAAGAVTFVAVQWTLARGGEALAPPGEFDGWRGILFGLFSYGSIRILESPIWLTALPAVATSYMLFAVYRAFELRAPEPPSNPTI